jgi:hypothetical protein
MANQGCNGIVSERNRLDGWCVMSFDADVLEMRAYGVVDEW